MAVDYRAVHFLCSAQRPRDYPPDEGLEVAFAGRSNAGKSSAINAVTGRRDIARTSKTPGRTQLLNFFALDPQRRLVDLPGYGYARVPEAVRRQWRGMVERYLGQRRSLRGIVVVLDIRRGLTDLDLQLLRWCAAARLPIHLLASKSDKLGRGAATEALRAIGRDLEREGLTATRQLFSASRGTGIDRARERLDHWLEAGVEAAREG